MSAAASPTSTATRRLNVPSRVADLGFHVDLPGDWTVHDLADDDLNFDNPTRLVGLIAVTAPHAAIVFSAAARPAYNDGTVSDWARYLIGHHGLAPRTQGAGQLGDLPAFIGTATQDSELGAMLVRYAFVEDGGRLIQVNLMAPELLASALENTWQDVLASFGLDSPKGATVPVWPPHSSEPGEVLAHDTDRTDNTAAAQACDEPTAPTKVIATTTDEPDALANHALADDGATLEPDHPVNQRLRDAGRGLTPRWITINGAERCATVVFDAIGAQINMPLGWHATDDGKRVLVFTPGGLTSLSFSLLMRDAEPDRFGDVDTAQPPALLDMDGMLARIETQARADYREPQCMRAQYGRLHVLGVRNIADGDEAIEQYHMLVDGPSERTVLRARITCAPGTAEAACNLAEAMLASVEFDRFDAPPPAADDSPAWLREARGLERANRLPEAEQAVLKGVPYQAGTMEVAELYRARMHRLAQAGDASGAAHARQRAVDWACSYAGTATSGGEGTAMSVERDAFIGSLGGLSG